MEEVVAALFRWVIFTAVQLGLQVLIGLPFHVARRRLRSPRAAARSLARLRGGERPLRVPLRVVAECEPADGTQVRRCRPRRTWLEIEALPAGSGGLATVAGWRTADWGPAAQGLVALATAEYVGPTPDDAEQRRLIAPSGRLLDVVGLPDDWTFLDEALAPPPVVPDPTGVTRHWFFDGWDAAP